MRVIYVGAQYNQRGVALREVHPDEIVLLVDMDRCIGCGSCRLACQAEHGDPAAARRVGLAARGGRPGKLLCLPTGCETCASPCDYADNSYWTFCPAEQAAAYAGPLCDHCAVRWGRAGLPPVPPAAP